jgi:hypothetical protein
MGDTMAAPWGVSASSADGRMVWPDENKSNIYHEDNRINTQNGLQSDTYERVNLNSRLKTMILNKQMNHQMQQYNQQMGMARPAPSDRSTAHQIMSPGDQQRSTSVPQTQYMSSSSTLMPQTSDARADVDRMLSDNQNVNRMMASEGHNSGMMGGRPTTNVERKLQLDNQSSSEANFLAQGHHPRNHPSVMTSEGGGFPWDWSSSASNDIMDSNSISAMENFIKYAASEDHGGVVDKSLDLAMSGASVKQFAPANTHLANFQQKPSSRQSCTSVNWHSPMLPQEQLSVTRNNNSSSNNNNNNNNNNSNNIYKDQMFKCTVTSVNTYKCTRECPVEVDDKSFQKRMGIVPGSRNEFQNDAYASVRSDVDVEEHSMQGMVTTGMCQYQQEYGPCTPQMKNEERKVTPTSLANNKYFGQQGYDGNSTHLKTKSQKPVANSMTGTSTFHCQIFDSMGARSEVGPPPGNATYSCQPVEQNTNPIGQNESRTAAPLEEVTESVKVKKEGPSYLFVGDGGPTPLEKIKGAWCCRQGGIETPTPEHLRDGCCQGFQTADEQVCSDRKQNLKFTGIFFV